MGYLRTRRHTRRGRNGHSFPCVSGGTTRRLTRASRSRVRGMRGLVDELSGFSDADNLLFCWCEWHGVQRPFGFS